MTLEPAPEAPTTTPEPDLESRGGLPCQVCLTLAFEVPAECQPGDTFVRWIDPLALIRTANDTLLAASQGGVLIRLEPIPAGWRDCHDDPPGQCLAGDRLLVIMEEREREGGPFVRRLVVLTATEDGWEATDQEFGGYTPADGLLWRWERDLVGGQ